MCDRRTFSSERRIAVSKRTQSDVEPAFAESLLKWTITRETNGGECLRCTLDNPDIPTVLFFN